MAKITSRYEPVWQRLKLSGQVTLKIAPGLHHRLFKAVRKRKNLDTEFNFTCAEYALTHSLRYELTGDGKIMTIKLIRTSIDLDDI